MVWSPPPDVRAAGESARVRNTQGSVIQPGQAAQYPIPPALRAFRDWVLAHFAGFTSGGMARASSRNHQVGQRRDVHEEGRAVDFMTARSASPEGTALANWLVLHAEQIGVQLVIWDHLEWSSSNIGLKFENYLSPPNADPHTSHNHVEISVEASEITFAAMTQRLDAAWSQSPPTAPSSGTSNAPSSGTTSGAAKTAFGLGLAYAFARFLGA